MWNPPRKEIKTVSPALAGEFLTTGPSDNPDFLTFNISTSAEAKVFEYRWKGIFIYILENYPDLGNSVHSI